MSSSSSSSSCRAARTDIPDFLSPLFPIAHRLVAAVFMFELVVLLLLGHKLGSV